MKLNPTQVFAQFALRISSGSRVRRRPLKTVLPAAADYVLESRLMLSATSVDETDDGGNTAGGDTGGGSGDPSTGGGSGVFGPDQIAGGDTLTGGGNTGTGGGGGDTSTGGSGMDNMPPMLSVMVMPIFDTAVNGDVVGYATATDVDGDAITFSFDGGSLTDPSGTFEINATTGVITIVNANNIGSQDETEDSPTGWSFIATIVASDGAASVDDASETVGFVVTKSPFRIISPTAGQTFVATTDDVIFEGTRPKGVRVKIVIYMKEADGIYRPINNPNFISTVEISGAGGSTTVTHNFHKALPGEYHIKYHFKTASGIGGWTDTGESVYFNAVAP